MKNLRKDTVRTRKQLLNAASGVFAEKGFRDSTIAEICSRAGANVAAVNYHFGNKKNLYREAWRHAFSESMKTCPPDGGIGSDASPEERLRGRITSLLKRISSPDSHEFSIIHKELANPTGLLQEILQKEINPQREAIHAIIRELLGSQASSRQVHFCHTSIIGQCFHLIKIRQLLAKEKSGDHPCDIDDIEAYGEHIFHFSLAGILALRHHSSPGRDDEGSSRQEESR
ncbi:MAG: CerR family C-terminal domain-containing protein [Pseudomonadota bacterium]